MIRATYALLLLSVLAGQACVQGTKNQTAGTQTAETQATKAQTAEAQTKTQTDKTAKITLIETGELFYAPVYDAPGQDVKIADGETWLGLYVTEGGSLLSESKVTVNQAARPRYPGAEELLKGDRVSVNRPTRPVFLVRDAARLKPGPVATIYQGGKAPEHVLMDGPEWEKKPRQLKLGDQEYQLKILERKVDENVVELKLALVSGKQTQILFTESAHLDHNEFYWRLLWAGDADGDGKLDLYVDSSKEYDNTTRTTLYFSSQAKPGQLVKEVATLVLIVPIS